MKEKIIEILKYSTRIMENENHTDYLIDNIDEVADEIVKLLTIPPISGSSLKTKEIPMRETQFIKNSRLNKR